MRNLLTLEDVSEEELRDLIARAANIKEDPDQYADALANQTLLMLFAKPSVRTRISFEAGMTQLGGHAIFYTLDESTLGKKETVPDFARVIDRYADVIMARLFEHATLDTIAANADVPVINGLTDFAHPCQILGDLLTLQEKKNLEDLTVAYVGDAHNNVTHSLLYGCAKLGIDIQIGCPDAMQPDEDVVATAQTYADAHDSTLFVTDNAEEAVKGAEAVYTDTWMSYHIPEEEKKQRVEQLSPYQVNAELMEHTNDALFMHCLPATRGQEVTNEVMDADASVVFDQAENRMHAQKALLVWLLADAA